MKLLTKTIGHKCQLVGDDLFVTTSQDCSKGIDKELAMPALKVNPIRTVTETINAVTLTT
jgi:enolase